jgi:hypothetical protein
VDLPKAESGSYGETFQDGNDLMKARVENIRDVAEDDGLVPVTIRAVKAEHEVSSRGLYQKYLKCILSLLQLYRR